MASPSLYSPWGLCLDAGSAGLPQNCFWVCSHHTKLRVRNSHYWNFRDIIHCSSSNSTEVFCVELNTFSPRWQGAKLLNLCQIKKRRSSLLFSSLLAPHAGYMFSTKLNFSKTDLPLSPSLPFTLPACLPFLNSVHEQKNKKTWRNSPIYVCTTENYPWEHVTSWWEIPQKE